MYQNKTVSICIPTWNRAAYLPRTVESIRRQNWPHFLEIIVVNSGYDEQTHRIADELGCRYSEIPRDEYPVFQNIAKHWNTCVMNSVGDVLILQTAEVVHESDHVLDSLVEWVCSGPKRVGTGLLRNLDKNDNFVDWYNHPTEGSRPGWKSGAGPIAIRRNHFYAVGGFEEGFYGYGHEDDFFYYCLKKCGFEVDYVPGAVCGHRDHPRMPFEVITCQANRCLLRTLWTQIEDEERFPIANGELPRPQEPPIPMMIFAMCERLIADGASPKFAKWYHDERIDPHTPEDTFVVHRDCANEGGGAISQACEMLVEAAWALKMQKVALDEASRSNEMQWANRCIKSARTMGTWAAVAHGKAIDYALKVELGKKILP